MMNDWSDYYEERSSRDRTLARDGYFTWSSIGSLTNNSVEQIKSICYGRRVWYGTSQMVAHLGEPVAIGSQGSVDGRRAGLRLIGSESGRLVVYDPPDDDLPWSIKHLRFEE